MSPWIPKYTSRSTQSHNLWCITLKKTTLKRSRCVSLDSCRSGKSGKRIYSLRAGLYERFPTHRAGSPLLETLKPANQLHFYKSKQSKNRYAGHPSTSNPDIEQIVSCVTLSWRFSLVKMKLIFSLAILRCGEPVWSVGNRLWTSLLRMFLLFRDFSLRQVRFPIDLGLPGVIYHRESNLRTGIDSGTVFEHCWSRESILGR